MKKAIGAAGIFNNQTLWIEGTIEDVFEHKDLTRLAMTGNPAAINALMREKYTFLDQPFYYCKMGNLGYIIARNDFRYTEVED